MGQIGTKNPLPAGLCVYYENNSKETLVGTGTGLRNKWRQSRKEGIVCLKVFENTQYNTWDKEKGAPGKALNIYNYSQEMISTDYYWFNDSTGEYGHGDTVPPGILPEDIALGKLTTDKYFQDVYNIALVHQRKPLGQGGESEIDPTLPSQTSTSFDGVIE